jgi:hypothetical protein
VSSSPFLCLLSEYVICTAFLAESTCEEIPIDPSQVRSRLDEDRGACRHQDHATGDCVGSFVIKNCIVMI